MKNRKFLIIGLIAIVAVLAIALFNFSSSASNQRDDAVRAAVFRYQMQQIPNGAKLYCLSVSSTGQDPSNELLAQFKNNKSTIDKLSDCPGEVDVYSTILTIDKISVGPKEAQVQGHIRSNDTEYSYFGYTVEQQNGQWVVTQVSPLKAM